jgi:hypothetical protein
MSTRASGKLVPLDKGAVTGVSLNNRNRSKGLKDVINENVLYEDVVDQINRKLALREAIHRANDAIASSRGGRS